MTEIHLPIFPEEPQGLERVPQVPSAFPVTLGEGFYPEEFEGNDPFRWMSLRGVISFAPRPEERFLEVSVFCEFGDLSQELEVLATGQEEVFSLVDGWRPMSLRIPPDSDHILLAVNKPFPPEYYPNDSRTLAVRVRGLRLHADGSRHTSIRRQWANAVLNLREMLDGETILESTPPSLGIDLHGACNVKPPCVYCEWDVSKEQEGENIDTPFNAETLRAYGPFFEGATQLVNCSIGEPFMMRNIDELLDVFGKHGKTLEMSTNGQTLTDRNIEKLLGRNIHLYISLDAATPETYARLRNQAFNKILDNIRRLVEAKSGRGNLPKVLLVFMPMRANVHEVDAFVELCAELGVDHMVLRPLNDTPGNNLAWERGGYRFEYDKELLPFDELVRVSGRAREQARRLGVDLHDQLDFGGSLERAFREGFTAGREGLTHATTSGTSPLAGATGPEGSAVPMPLAELKTVSEGTPPLGFEKRPVCTEPWERLYILRRGIRPCCYGGAPIAEMDDYGNAWNSPLVQSIRKELLRGSFHKYCLKSPACPIVRKSEHGRRLSLLQRGLIGAWRSWHALNALTGGAPRWVLKRFRRFR